ncbi:T9SS type A sorting domain-containing protein [Flavobacterium sp.]|uniref:T9SS type A sorting domain-containing protein n=1 Tax=Flavobacterium sp. TaxID=239 RepID=UPI00286C8397|nr:T9SS type A sorting domain-containing protein [Flavobacterium sp.]
MKIKLLFSLLLMNTFFLTTAANKFLNFDSPPSATISYNSPFCFYSTLEYVNLVGTTGGTFSASPAGLFIDATSGDIHPNQSTPGTYSVTYDIPAGVDPAFSTTTTVTINALTYAGVDGGVTVCESSTTTINLFSLITGEQPGGTWVEISGTGGTFNAAAGTYLPSYGSTPSAFMYTVAGTIPCANDSSIANVIVTQQPYAGTDGATTVCNTSTTTIDLYSLIIGEQAGGVWTRTSGSGGTFNAVAGTYTPSPDATTSTFTYTIPAVAPCLNDTSMVTITINPVALPNFAQIAPICSGSTPPILPAVSPNGIAGTWSPSVISTQIVGTYVYVFTPNMQGLCANSQSLTVTVVPLTVPTFSFQGAYCQGSVIPPLPTTSNNGISGIWTPSVVDNQISSTYMFTPNAGECATTTSLTILVSPTPQATIIGNTTVCQGTSATITFMGTPNSMVSYGTDGPIQTIALNASGMATITTPILNATTAICLVSVTSGNCTAPLSGCAIITVALNVIIPPMPDVTVCGQYTLPTLQIGGYYTAPNGGGTMLHAGDVITATQLIYVYLPGMCSSNEESFVVIVFPIVNPTISTVDNINYIVVEDNQIVQTLELNTEVQTGNYTYQWMESQNDIIGANGSSYTVNNLINGGLHYYSVRITNNDTNCVTESPVFQVFETPVPAPTGDVNQTFTLGQTLADVVVSGQNIQWYDVMNRNATSNPLPLSTVLVEGVTYYATQTINGHESASAFEITIQFLANNTFAFKDLKFSPNPVQDILYIQSKDLIQDVTLYNMMGQKILQQNFESLDLRLQLSQLKAGNYFIKLESDNKSQVIKVIKE